MTLSAERTRGAIPARRLLICSSGIPHESRGASVVLFYHYIARLCRDGYRILHVVLLADDEWPDADVDAYAAKLADPADRARVTVTPVRAARFFRERRFRHRLAPGIARQVEEIGRAFRPDVVVAFDILAAWLIGPTAAARRLAWLGDLRFQTVLYHALYAARENPLMAVHIPSNWLACRAWRRVYREALAGFDQVVTASGASVGELARLGVAASYEPYPWPDDSAPVADRASLRHAIPTFVFFGALGGLGSRSALHFILRRLLPRLRREWGRGGFRLRVAGSGALPGWAAAAFADATEIETLGFVEDLDALFAACHAVVIPIDAPIGNRSRILTAMAHRTPVVAHANAALGNPDLRDGDTCFLATDAAGFAARMRRAVEDREAVDAIVARAYRMFVERFGVEAATGRMSDRIAALAEA
jgi:glycosyltransferase involved in cell wall biosynthesis